jgi:hypothetical protein
MLGQMGEVLDVVEDAYSNQNIAYNILEVPSILEPATFWSSWS